MGNVNINGRTGVHAGSQGTLNTVDVCKVPNRCPARTFNNVAMSSNSAKTAGTVFINGNPVCHKDSIFAVSEGDESGSCGGVNSGTIKQKAEFVTFSNNVFIEGKPAVRQADMMVSNNRNTPPAPLQQPGAGMPPEVSPQGAQQTQVTKQPNELPYDVAGADMNLLKNMLSID